MGFLLQKYCFVSYYTNDLYVLRGKVQSGEMCVCACVCVWARARARMYVCMYVCMYYYYYYYYIYYPINKLYTDDTPTRFM